MLEVPIYPPITKEIPGAPDGYLVHSDGFISLNGKRLEGYRGRDYRPLSIKGLGFVLVHRIVAEAFVPGKTDERSFVNHLDEDKTNHDSFNLEWVTTGENQSYSIVKNGSDEFPKVLVREPSGNWDLVSNLNKASEISGIPSRKIWECIRNEVSYKGWSFYHKKARDGVDPTLRNSPWGENGRGFGKLELQPVKIQDYITKEIVEYDSYKQAGDAHGVKANNIYQLISTPDKIRLFKQRYLIVKNDDDFPELSQEAFEAMVHKRSAPVVAYDIDKDIMYSFRSGAEFVREGLITSIKRKGVYSRLQFKGVSVLDGIVFCYQKPENVEAFKEKVAFARGQ